ncbi:MFS transporter [Pedococcus aerophilus]|uniref:MFS transporter n=1 Tax=Pedococcus aerophilus TaxID=436356 RepID=A0ABN3UMP0_9MICO
MAEQSNVPAAPAPGMSRARTLLFAVAGGAAVGNLYWAQPLLEEMAAALRVSQAVAGLLVTVTQIGYAVGIFLVVPLGDVLNRRRLVPGVLVASGVALFAAAAAPTWTTALLALTAVGLTSVGAQLLIPLAGDLADPQERGRVVGTIVSGVLVGILLSRTISGVVADLFGWRAIYVLAGVLAWAFAAVLLRVLPTLPSRDHLPYGRLLASVFTAIRSDRAVPVTLVLGSSGFAVFTLLWTAMTFLLTAPPFSYSLTTIGLVGFAGLAGALAARGAGRLHDRGLSVPVTGAALALALASLALAALGQQSIVVLLVAVVLFDVTTQAAMILNQTRLLSIDPEARSRMNTAFVTANFIGGAIGSAMAGVLWHHGGWRSVMAGGGGVLALALVVWCLNRRTLAAVRPAPAA